MAVISGTGGTAGGSLPPPPAPPSPPATLNLPPGGFVGSPAPSGLGLASLINWENTPVTTTPNYAGILDQYMGPIESAFNAQMAALRDQMAHQRGFAQEAYGINKESDQAAYDAWLKEFIAKLVGRGMFNSGARRYYTRLQLAALQRQLALLKNNLQSYLYGLQSNVTNAQLSGQASLAAQRQSIGMQLPSLYPATVAYPNENPWGPPGTPLNQGA